MDWRSRYVVAWRLSNTLEGDFCVDALRDALEQGQPKAFNTDQKLPQRSVKGGGKVDHVGGSAG